MRSLLSVSLQGLALWAGVVMASCADSPPSQNPFASVCEFEKPGTAQLFHTFSLIAHRGTLGELPENTVRSLNAALNAGAAMAEVDVHFSSDGVPVVIHDDTLERTTEASGPVAALTVAELQALDAGSWAGTAYQGDQIPTLAEVLRAASGRARLLLDIKTDGLGAAVRRVLDDERTPQEVLSVAVQTPAQADDFATYTPDAQLLWNFEAPNQWHPSLFAELRATGIDGIELGANWSPGFVSDAHAHGFPVYAYIVNDPAMLRNMVAMGIDGVETDALDTFVPILEEMGWTLTCDSR